MHWRRVILTLAVLAAPSFCATPVGIPRELAQARAELVSDLRYRLHFTLVPHASTTAGRVELRFQLRALSPLLIDYRDGVVRKLEVNDSDTTVEAENGHIVLPRQKLRVGENRVAIDFESPVAPAGKAITRYEDKDDGSEYIYTLFVPMDASMAFPCFDQPDLKGRFRLEIIAPASWTVVSNTAPESDIRIGGREAQTFFAETRPIRT